MKRGVVNDRVNAHSTRSLTELSFAPLVYLQGIGKPRSSTRSHSRRARLRELTHAIKALEGEIAQLVAQLAPQFCPSRGSGH